MPSAEPARGGARRRLRRALLIVLLVPPLLMLGLHLWVTRRPAAPAEEAALYVIGLSLLGAAWLILTPLLGLLALLARWRQRGQPTSR